MKGIKNENKLCKCNTQATFHEYLCVIFSDTKFKAATQKLIRAIAICEEILIEQIKFKLLTFIWTKSYTANYCHQTDKHLNYQSHSGIRKEHITEDQKKSTDFNNTNQANIWRNLAGIKYIIDFF